MSCRPHDTSSGDGGVSDECEISANNAEKQDLSSKYRKINRQSLYDGIDDCSELNSLLCSMRLVPWINSCLLVGFDVKKYLCKQNCKSHSYE